MSLPGSLDQQIADTRLVRLQRLPDSSNGGQLFAKLEGDNPAGSVKDRPAHRMIKQALARGDIQVGDTLIEATSGNTGIALAMVAAIVGIRMVLIMPENLTVERRQLMLAYGAELVLVSKEEGMEGARDRALAMQAAGEGKVLNQFANDDNPEAHYLGTGPEIWRQTKGLITHFVSAMGTTGTIMGVSRYLKEQNPGIQIIGVQPTEGSSIPGIRTWPEEYLPKIYDSTRVDKVLSVSQAEAESCARQMAVSEGIFGGISSGGAMHVALDICATARDAVVVTIVCDRGDRYLSSGVFGG